jgi:hypothetical protein
MIKNLAVETASTQAKSTVRWTNYIRILKPAQAGSVCVAKPLLWAGSPTCRKWRALAERACPRGHIQSPGAAIRSPQPSLKKGAIRKCYF